MEWTWLRREFRGGGRGWTTVAVAAGWFFAQGLRTALPVLLPSISDDYGLRLASGGALISLMFVAYAIGQLPGGILGDRYGERNVLVGSVLLMTTGVVVVSSLGTLAALVVGIAALGFGCGTFAPMRFTILSDLYPDRDGTAQGVVLAVGDVGNTILPPVAGAIATVVTWRLGLGVSVPVLIAVTAGLWIVVPRRTAPIGQASGDRQGNVLEHVSEELRRGTVLQAVALLFAISFIFQGQVGMYPSYLVIEKGIPEPVAGAVFGLFFGSSVLVHVIAGASVDRFSEPPVLVTLFWVGASGFLLLPFVGSLPAIVFVTVLISASIGVFTVSITYLIQALGDRDRGATFGFIRSVYIAIAALSPWLIGFLGDAGQFDLGFVMLGVFAALGGILSWQLPPAT